MGIYDKVDEKQKQIIIKFGEVIYTLLGFDDKTDKDIIKMLNDETIDIKEKIKDAFVHGKNINIEEIDYYKILEDKLLDIGAIKTLISTNSYSESDFWRVWNKENYTKVKSITDPQNIFRNLYTKMCT